MKILLAASEVAPIIKLGGLGDVAGSLPKALSKLGVQVDVIAPFFSFANITDLQIYKNFELTVGYSGETYIVEVYKTKLPGSDVNVILLKNDTYFHKYGPTWKLTNEEEVVMFSFFDRCVVEYIKSMFNTYDLIHCNDWHTGLITHLLHDEIGATRPATLFTIHNFMYQGVATSSIVRKVGIVPGEHPLIDWDISDGDLNMIEQGIGSADFINTVSPTYMQEILTKEYGGDLSDILLARNGRIAGILNGLDYTSLPRKFDIKDAETGKKLAKDLVKSEIKMVTKSDRPLFAFVGRLDPYQKGIDILYEIVPNIVKMGGDIVVLGTGDAVWEEKLRGLANENISINIAFDNNLARKIYEGSDFLIVPSKYEPCGLIQMIAMWYGSLPIVRATGGLKDSVEQGKTGFLFENYSADSLLCAVESAFAAYNGHTLSPMIKAAMTKDFSWDKSAIEYQKLYTKVIQIRKESL